MRRCFVALAVAGLAATTVVTVPAPARALNPATITADTAPTWQTNDRVWSLAHANGVVYAGGEFTSVRPPGAAAGIAEEPRNRLAAFDAETGEVLPFAHEFNGTIRVLASSPDGSTVYAGGDFTTVDGVSRPRIAAFDTATGALEDWRATPYSGVRAIAVTDTTVYFGGNFAKVDGQARSRLAAYSTSGGLLPWAPSVDGTVRALLVSPDGSRVIIGGSFDQVNDSAFRSLGSVFADSGATAPWVDHGLPGCVGCGYGATITTLATDGTHVFAAAETLTPGLFEGTLAVIPSTGELVWKNDCRGANQSIAVLNEILYVASHAHNCRTVPGGFGPGRPRIGQHLLAQRTTDGHIQPWWPDTNGGGPTGDGLGPRALVAAGDDLWVAGEFTTVNDQPQQGISRLVASPDTELPKRPTTAPTVSALADGDVRVKFKATWDRDDGDLTYRVYRDGDDTTPVWTTTRFSTFFELPKISFVDRTAAPGVHTYRFDATDGINVSPKSPPATVMVVGPVLR